MNINLTNLAPTKNRKEIQIHFWKAFSHFLSKYESVRKHTHTLAIIQIPRNTQELIQIQAEEITLKKKGGGGTTLN